MRVVAGYIPKAGEPTRLVREALVTAYPKAGAIGVLVRIVPPEQVSLTRKDMGGMRIQGESHLQIQRKGKMKLRSRCC